MLLFYLQFYSAFLFDSQQKKEDPAVWRLILLKQVQDLQVVLQQVQNLYQHRLPDRKRKYFLVLT